MRIKNSFRFKQFEVDQQGCAMKINTDGVLLAATAGHSGPAHILDIGTGTGVIALMLAQRFPGAKIDAVEIDAHAASAAAGNFSSSPFSARLKAFQADIRAYETETRYDLIVSNPPFFINDLKNPEERKSLARHTDEDFFAVLIRKAAAYLTADGLLWLILPVKQAGQVIDNAGNSQLSLQRMIDVHSDSSKPVIRKIVCLGREQEGTETSRPQVGTEKFYIYQAGTPGSPSKAIHSEAYKQLLKDFFLAF